MNFNYSDHEWDYLIHYQEWEWPEEWGELRNDIEQWRAVVEDICREHDLPFDAGMEITSASNAAFLTGDMVVKIFARRSPIWFPREVEALRVLENHPGAKSPRLLAHGEVTNGKSSYPYIIMERIPGEIYRSHRDTMSEEERAMVMVQLAGIVRAVHETPIDGLRTFGTTPEEWVARMQARAETCANEFLELPPYFLKDMPKFLAENLPAITTEFQPRLLHADVISGNIMVEKRAGAWEITGLIDYGDVEVGPIEYEWVPACHKAMLSDPKLVRTFFETYGWPLPVSDETRRQLKAYTLLHRFTMLPFLAEDHPEITSLDALVDSLWPI